jgi:hypothetical protein
LIAGEDVIGVWRTVLAAGEGNAAMRDRRLNMSGKVYARGDRGQCKRGEDKGTAEKGKEHYTRRS